MRILVLEDEKNLNKVISKRLAAEAYAVDSTFDGEEAYEALISDEYDAAVLDVMTPKLDGFSLVRKIRAENIDVPVLFLTARGDVEDRVEGLDSGADDYLVKPFSFDELLARIRVLIRRRAGLDDNVITVADLSVNLSKRGAARAGKEISLSAKEYELLRYLALNKDFVLSREQIENHVWNYDYEGGTNVVDVYIRYLRKKIDDDFEPKLIRTVRGIGYVLKEK